MVKYIVAIFIGFFTLPCLAQALTSTAQASLESADKILKDPTKPLGYQVKSVKKQRKRPALPKLQSILLNQEQKRAIINNQFYEVGQKVNGYKIKRIDKEAVLLVYAGKSYRITLYSNQEKFSQ